MEASIPSPSCSLPTPHPPLLGLLTKPQNLRIAEPEGLPLSPQPASVASLPPTWQPRLLPRSFSLLLTCPFLLSQGPGVWGVFLLSVGGQFEVSEHPSSLLCLLGWPWGVAGVA